LTFDCSSVSRASKKNYPPHLVFTVTSVPEGGSPVEFTSEALFDWRETQEILIQKLGR